MLRLLASVSLLCVAEISLMAARTTQLRLREFRDLRLDILTAPQTAAIKHCKATRSRPIPGPMSCQTALYWQEHGRWTSPCPHLTAHKRFQIERYYRLELRCRALSNPILTAHLLR